MEDLSREELDQLIGVFREQTLQILDEMGHDLLTLEAGGVDSDCTARLKRCAHTIKGDSACLGMEGVARLAHKIEDVLEASFSDEAGIDEAVVDLILESLDLIKASVDGEGVSDIPEGSLESLQKRLSAAEARELSEGGRKQSRAGSEDEGSDEGSSDRGRSKEIERAVSRRDFVRVEAGRIDSLLNLAGELVIARSMLNQVSVEIETDFASEEVVSRFNASNNQIGKLISQLQKSVLMMRMVTVDHVFKRFVRPMRELAQEHGKRVEMKIEGGKTELDRSLVDALYEPLLHLLRNAVDHGLEAMSEREAAGKSPCGSIKLRAYQQGNQVVIEVSDDGRGIDVEAVKRKAVKAGIISDDEAARMSEADALDLIFMEGLSTATEITQVSGRGIGTVAARTAVESLRGTITATTQPGKGTAFTIKMPLTLAIMKGLLFTAAGRLFAMPLSAISEIALLKGEEIVRLDGFESYCLRGNYIALVRPGLVLGYERRKGGAGAHLRRQSAEQFLIVLYVEGRKYGMIADTLLGQQELVIKPLESEWVSNEGLSGASVLGDGRVVLILDASMLYRKAVRVERNLTEGYMANGF